MYGVLSTLTLTLIRGCVTGKVLESLRATLAVPGTPGTYRWDALDGYDSGGAEKNSLEQHPDLQAKVRRCVEQGFIDPEDFNGDPEMNVLGAVGLRTQESKKKMRDDQMARTHAFNEMTARIAALEAEVAVLRANGAITPRLGAEAANAKTDLNEQLDKGSSAGKKRVKDESDGDEATPAKKKRATKKKTDPEDDDDRKPVKPAPKSRSKKGVKLEEDDDDDDDVISVSKPAPKTRVKKGVKLEEDDDDTVDAYKPAPTRRPRGKKGAKAEDDTEMSGAVDQLAKLENDADAPATVSAPKKRASRKNAVKVEPIDEDAGIDNVEPKKKPASKKRGKKVVKDEPVEEPALAEEPNPGVTEGSSVETDVRGEGEAEGAKEGPTAIAIAGDGHDAE